MSTREVRLTGGKQQVHLKEVARELRPDNGVLTIEKKTTRELSYFERETREETKHNHVHIDIRSHELCLGLLNAEKYEINEHHCVRGRDSVRSRMNEKTSQHLAEVSKVTLKFL